MSAKSVWGRYRLTYLSVSVVCQLSLSCMGYCLTKSLSVGAVCGLTLSANQVSQEVLFVIKAYLGVLIVIKACLGFLFVTQAHLGIAKKQF